MTSNPANLSRADRLAQAQAAILELAGDYKSQLQTDVAALKEIWSQTDKNAPSSDQVGEIFSIAHNLKGQAGSFGYGLVTAIAASLCEMTRDNPDCTNCGQALDKHVRILDQVVTKDIKGDGGEAGAKIVALLKTL
ncbi:MAG: Hpt domain-containing protein [Alphaproteobacteria bacterium]|nr:Hpt domain-containing protein [Alphaproteobacteria bacterium]MBO6628604.1 Hpt domain-containing protein [Alphaproteobacteria bacterium]MDF1626823.1 Hpt domain-containing protein [Parvibaculaceae bacterium]|tara:strand:+ start:201 stop:608 length:408 start_codon:yes stop_codon:yes gene_type:complete